MDDRRVLAARLRARRLLRARGGAPAQLIAALAAVAVGAAAASCAKPPIATPSQQPIDANSGALTVLARDHDTGDQVRDAALSVTGPVARAAASSKYGFATFDHLPPGRYDVHASHAGQAVAIVGVDIHAKQITYVDVAFTPASPDPITRVFADASAGAIDRYRPPTLAADRARLEGHVIDALSHERVVGAVVTLLVAGRTEQTEQTITDDHGEYRFDDLAPATYAVSAYYSVGGRGQIEVRRSGIELHAGEATIVPLAIEVAR